MAGGMDQKNLLIVGGSSGIGLELVQLLSVNHHDVYVGSRSNAALAAIPGLFLLLVAFVACAL
jgi:short-subunit dehydrogenase